MTEPTHCPVVSFDHHSQEHGADPVASYRALRQAAPVAWTEAHGGYWVVSGYAGLFDAARDDATFSSARNSHGGEGLSVVIPKTPMHHHIPIEIDPPDFRKYRKIINLITSPSAAERMSDLVLEYTTRFIDDVIEAGECDFASVIGVPAAVTIHWLGLPVQDWRRYAAAHHAVLASEPGSAEYVRAATVELPSLSRQMAEVIAARHKEPRDDVISFLVHQEIDGAPISDPNPRVGRRTLSTALWMILELSGRAGGHDDGPGLAPGSRSGPFCWCGAWGPWPGVWVPVTAW